MAGLGITDLPKPSWQWRVDVHASGFESEHNAASWDAKRSRILRKRAKLQTGRRRKRLLELADQLDPEKTPEIPQTPASARYLREQRIRIIGSVWKLVAEDQTGKVVRFDVIKPSWAYSREQLRLQTPQRLRAEFRAELLRAALKVKPSGAADCKGFLFAVLHGEFESPVELFQLHWHLVATGDWVAVVDELRELKAYKRTDEVRRPIRAERKLHNLPYALTYLMKSYWPGKWRGYVSSSNNKRRTRGHGRMPDKANSATLLWLDQWKLSKSILMINLRTQLEGLITK